MAELKRCPECGGVATVIHDGLHTKKMKVSGLPSKEKAIEAWNRRSSDADERT